MPDEEKRSPYDIRAIFETLTLGLIANLRRNLMRHQNEEVTEGFRWEMWQKAKLRALSGFRKVNRKLVRDALKEAEQLTSELIQQSYDDGAKRTEEQTRRAAKRAAEADIEFPEDIKQNLPQSAPAATPGRAAPKPAYDKLPHAGQEEEFFGLNEKKLAALEKSVKKDIRKAGGSVLRKMDDVYRQTIFAAEAHMAAGVKTLPQAIDMATREFLDRGIDSITYSNGRKINIASYSEMALRTASQRATFLGEGSRRAELGVRTVVISAHANCSDLCLPWQGKAYIDDVYSGGTEDDGSYPLLSKAMAGGLFHPNCRHSMATFFPEISRLPAPVDEAKAREDYQAEQRQRYMERTIRKYKRREAGAVDEENQEAAAAKVKQWQGLLRDHLDGNKHLRRDYRREKA